MIQTAAGHRNCATAYRQFMRQVDCDGQLSALRVDETVESSRIRRAAIHCSNDITLQHPSICCAHHWRHYSIAVRRSRRLISANTGCSVA
jgi:hypothetical protein